jgi:hypothetical protein
MATVINITGEKVMAKFKQNNVELRDNQKLIFDSSKNKHMSYDGSELYINNTVSGVTPTEDYHLTTKDYVDNIGSIFGGEYDYAESESESSTTSNTYQQKLRLTTSTVPAGTYRIGWSFAHASTTDKLDCGFKIELDDTTVLSEPIPNMKGKSAGGSYYGMSGFKHTSLTNASHTIDIDYIANLNLEAGTTYIKQARIEIWRVE